MSLDTLMKEIVLKVKADSEKQGFKLSRKDGFKTIANQFNSLFPEATDLNLMEHIDRLSYALNKYIQ